MCILTLPMLTPAKNEAYEKAIGKIRDAGAHVEYPVPLPSFIELTMPDGNMTAMQVVMCKYLAIAEI